MAKYVPTQLPSFDGSVLASPQAKPGEQCGFLVRSDSVVSKMAKCGSLYCVFSTVKQSSRVLSPFRFISAMKLR